MKFKAGFIISFLCYFQIHAILSPAEGSTNTEQSDSTDFYRAAVVEYAGDDGAEYLTPEKMLWKNVENYEKLIAQAAEQRTDIIVFPEHGLTSLSYTSFSKNVSFRPILERIPEVGVNPCIHDECSIAVDSEVIQHLSCAAKRYGMYVVVNLLELVPATTSNLDSNEKRDLRYNTAVTFDRDGTIVAKYHKYNLFAEQGLDIPEIAELSTFKTDFGVEFGIFICFDMLFEKPAKQLVANGIKHFVFPTAWIDELPFLTAIQSQMFWASSSEATLLASGFHHPAIGSMGSGIYSPSGQPLNYTFSPDSGTLIVYAQVPKNPEKSTLKSTQLSQTSNKIMDEIFSEHWYYKENLANYTGVTLPLVTGENMVSACDQGFCCEIQYTYSKSSGMESVAQDNDGTTHKLIVFNQQRKFSSPSVVRLMGLQVCAVVRCRNNTMESCAEYSVNSGEDPLPAFDSIRLTASPFTPYLHSKPGFTTLDTNLEVIPVELFEQNSEKGKSEYSVITSAIKDFQIQTVALFNRVFSDE